MIHFSNVASRWRTFRTTLNILLTFCFALPFVWLLSNLCVAGLQAVGR
jgi:hypothetical protein